MTNQEHDNMVNEQLRAVEMALRPAGVLYEVAQAALAEPLELTPQEAGDVILQRKRAGEDFPARYILAESADPAVEAAANSHADEIYKLAEEFGNRKADSLDEAELSRIDGQNSVWAVEGGANRTSIVRRELAIEAMRAIYGDEEIETKELFQFGGATVVPAVHPDGNPNAQHKVAQEIASDFLVPGEDFTEFGLNLATALQAGYEIVEDVVGGPAADRRVSLRKSGNPKLVLIQPAKQGELSGTENGFTTLSRLVGDLSGKQLVVATNGQYRFKVGLQAQRWADRHDITMLPPVILGDESGFKVMHDGKKLVTADRKPLIYLNDFIVLSRMANQEQS